MAYKLVERILRVRGITLTQKAVLAQTASYCNKTTKIAWPEAATIAADLACNEKTVRRAWTALAKAGFLIVHKRATQHSSTRWKFGHDAIDAHARPDSVSGLELEGEGARPDSVSARPDSASRQTGHSVRLTRKEPERTTRGRAREPGARAPALEPANPAPRQTEMLLPITGGRAARDPLRDARGRLAAAREALAAMSADDPQREVHVAIVARIEAEIGTLEAA